MYFFLQKNWKNTSNNHNIRYNNNMSIFNLIFKNFSLSQEIKRENRKYNSFVQVYRAFLMGYTIDNNSYNPFSFSNMKYSFNFSQIKG